METATQEALPRLVTADVVAEETGLKKSRVYELVRQGVLPHARIGRSVRFDRGEVRRWIASGGAGLDDE